MVILFCVSDVKSLDAQTAAGCNPTDLWLAMQVPRSVLSSHGSHILCWVMVGSVKNKHKNLLLALYAACVLAAVTSFSFVKGTNRLKFS